MRPTSEHALTPALTPIAMIRFLAGTLPTLIELGDFKIPTLPKEPGETKKDEKEKTEIRTEGDANLVWGADRCLDLNYGMIP